MKKVIVFDGLKLVFRSEKDGKHLLKFISDDARVVKVFTKSVVADFSSTSYAFINANLKDNYDVITVYCDKVVDFDINLLGG